MGWFKNKGNLNQTILKVDKKIQSDGIRFQIIRTFPDGKQINCSLPLQQISIRELNESGYLSMIEGIELADSDEKMFWEEETESYFLPFDQVYELEDYILHRLELPSESSNLQVKLNTNTAVGMRGFRIESLVMSRQHGNLTRFAKRFGSYYQLPSGELLLIPKKMKDLFDFLDKVAPEGEEQFEYVAKIKQLAEDAGAKLNDSLQNEDYVLLDKHDIDVNVLSENEIELIPIYQSSIQSIEPYKDEIQQLAQHAERYGIYSTKGKRTRIIASKSIQNAAKEIKKQPRISGTDVPKFIENPANYLSENVLPDEMLDLFSERVKGLGLRIYHSHPYIQSKKDRRGWFNLDFGYHLTPISTNEGKRDSEQHNELDVEGNIELSEFAQLVEEARKKGEEYILYNGSWVKVPDDTEEFINQVNRYQEEIKSIDPTRLPYVLEIFSNIDSLEYDRTLLNELNELENIGIFEQPPEFFKANLYDYQKEGYRWLKKLSAYKIGGLLADDMGLGKTVQIISLLASLKEKDRLRPSLIIAPLSLIDNWVKEIKRFASPIQIYRHQGVNRVKQKDLLEKSDVVLCSYETLVRDQILLAQVDWKVVITDEAQKIKNPSTAVSSAVKALKNDVRIALTGTPVENGLTELWSIMDFVQPGLLGSLAEFKKNYEKPIMQDGEDISKIRQIEQQLLYKIQPVYLRRTKKEHLSHRLPEKIDQLPIEVPLSKSQEMLYQSIIHQVKNKQVSPFAALSQLKQVCAHPGLYDPTYENENWSNIPKLKVTMDILESIRKKGEKALIFVEYIQLQIILQRIISEHFGIRPMIINGSTSRRQQIVDQFNHKNGFDVLLLSPKAAGIGLTITGANHVIHYTRWWNPAVENQATDRAYRIGQTKDVYVYYPMVVSNFGETLEVLVDRLLREKRQLVDSIIIPSKQLEIENDLQRLLFQ